MSVLELYGARLHNKRAIFRRWVLFVLDHRLIHSSAHDFDKLLIRHHILTQQCDINCRGLILTIDQPMGISIVGPCHIQHLRLCIHFLNEPLDIILFIILFGGVI